MLQTAVIQRIQTLLSHPDRSMIGIAASPGAGKSTFVQTIVDYFGDQVAVIPMDGFHLANAELKRLNRANRKGAPDTFDVDGYINLLQRLRQQSTDEIIYAPYFERSIEEAIANSIAITPDKKLIITEGNYLLLDQKPWSQITDLLDEAWYLKISEATRLERLVNRHIAFGRTADEAHAWVEASDEPNARLIEASQSRADWTLEL